VSVELSLNHAIVNIRRKRLILKSQKSLYLGQGRKSRSRSMENKDAKKRSRSGSEDKKNVEKPARKLKWVIPNLIVRVVSKKVSDGKLYNKKLHVTDVLSAF
jgi:hypothetical protein